MQVVEHHDEHAVSGDSAQQIDDRLEDQEALGCVVARGRFRNRNATGELRGDPLQFPAAARRVASIPP